MMNDERVCDIVMVLSNNCDESVQLDRMDRINGMIL